ncbi:unnamed protein product [Larinioides sclopetarius]|uniref:Uncharacterized protein n=1 Tax=Larinioides sclopetarius TaxID=280406 RepID=A0AAV1ZPK1_9ARAC
MGVEINNQAPIADTEDGKTTWDTLKANFELYSRARLASLVEYFFSSSLISTKKRLEYTARKQRRIINRQKKLDSKCLPF